MATPRSRGPPPIPPDKGSFPLDHFGECSTVKEEYSECIRKNRGKSEPCKELAAKYLECRMEK